MVWFVGQQVVVNSGSFRNRREVTTVEKVGKLHFKVLHRSEKYRVSDGCSIGYSSSKVELATAELLADIADEKQRTEALREIQEFADWIRGNDHSVSTKNLLRVSKLVNKLITKNHEEKQARYRRSLEGAKP